MFLPTLCSLLLGAALAKPGPVGKQDPQPLPGARDGLIEPRQIEPKELPVYEDAKASYVLSSGLYYFTSPNYPNDYPNSYFERWVFSGDQGQVISVDCDYYDDFAVEEEQSCAFDFLRINGVKYCTGRLPPSSVSGTRLNVVFRTDSDETSTGFFCLLTVPGDGGTTQCCGIPNRETRIVGGEETEVNEYPWQVALASHFSHRPVDCGGTLINTQWVMTAAHCTEKETEDSLYVLLRKHHYHDDTNEIYMDVIQIEDHPLYNSVEEGHDFSLLKLSEAIDFSSENNLVAPACLPQGGNDFADVDAIVSGWGDMSSEGSRPSALLDVTVQTMSNAECDDDLEDEDINSSMICADVDAGGKDSCQGDSGGPLVTLVDGRYNLIGVVSFGNGCGDQDSPGVYARVTAVSDWIATTTAGTSLC